MQEPSLSVKPLPQGAQVGPFTIVSDKPIGIGGMAIVYKAKLHNKGPVIALKVAHAGLGGFLKDETAFLKSLNLEHPHIIDILSIPLGGRETDYIVRDPGTGCWYFAMEYMAGGSLEDWMNRHKMLDLRKSLEVIQQVGSALDVAHKAGLMHLDVKPSNILFRTKPEKGSTHAVLTDFGIARPKGRVASGQTTMTVEYASPEQVRLVTGEEVNIGPASDLYSLAAVFYEMISGKLPHQAANDTALMQKIVNENPSPLLRHNSSQLQTIMQRALAKEPKDRYASAAAMVADLKSLPTEVFQTPPSRRMHPLLGLGLGALIGFVLGMPVGRYVLPADLSVVAESTTAAPASTREIATPTLERALELTDAPAATPTEISAPATDAPTRAPTSTPVPPTNTPTYVPPTATPGGGS